MNSRLENPVDLPAQDQPSVTASENLPASEPASEIVARAARLERQGQDEAALQLVRQAIQQPAIGARIWEGAGQIAYICGDAETAERCWRRLTEIESWDPRWSFRDNVGPTTP
jgi:hypothetical protein